MDKKAEKQFCMDKKAETVLFGKKRLKQFRMDKKAETVSNG